MVKEREREKGESEREKGENILMGSRREKLKVDRDKEKA
jgi:hypothetical protein